MSNEIAHRPDTAAPMLPTDSPMGSWAGELMAWADAAQKAHQIAEVLCETSFVPKTMYRRPGEVTGAILTGMELHVPIMWALGNIDIVEGRPGVSAKGQRALLKRAGHDIWTEETTASRAVVCARHKGEQRVEKSVWTLDRAKKANLLGKKNWQLYPQDMLLNRATAEAARLAVPDIALGMYTLDELDADGAASPNGAGAPASVAQDAPEKKPRRAAQRKTAPPPPPVDPGALPADIPTPPADISPGRSILEDASTTTDEQRPRVVSEAQAVATMEAAGFEIVDVIDTMGEDESDAERHSYTAGELAATCDAGMPHDLNKGAPDGCPPNCPTRIETDESMQAEYHAEQDAAFPALMTDAQRKRMGAEMRRIGLVDRGERLAFAARIVGHEVETSNELTVQEASEVIQALTAEGLDRVETRYDRDGDQ